MKDPNSPEEWQDAVDQAEFYLHLHASVSYGLINYNGQINVARCEEIKARGQELGVTPAPDAVERTLAKQFFNKPRLNIAGGKDAAVKG